MLGRASIKRWSEFEAHLLTCPRCESTVDELTELSDTCVRELCRRPSMPEDEPVFQSLYTRLLASDLTLGDDGKAANGDRLKLPYRLGNYELLAPLGHGANASVFRARHVPLDRIVAIKLLRPDQDFDSTSVDRFVQEVRAVGRLDHPHVVRATDAGETAGQHFLVMEYVPGVDLSTVVLTCAPLQPCEACELVRQAALGLEYLHENGFVHRDVKPSNLLLTAEGQTKLLDLGLVQFVAHEAATTSSGKVPHGTADYMSPEQWREFDQVDFRSDLYSLGCTLCKLLTGSPPFRPLPPEHDTKFLAHSLAPIPSLRELRSNVPEALQNIFERLLAKRPEDRFESAQELSRQLAPLARGAKLRRLAQQAGLTPVAPSVSAAPTGRKLTRRQALFASAAATGAVMAGWSVWRRKRVPQATYFKTDAWRPLTPAVPRVLVPLEPEGDSLWESVGEKKWLIRAPRQTLLNLGQPMLGIFHFAVDLTLLSWQDRQVQANAGVFFQYSNHAQRVGTLQKFQTLELVRDWKNATAGYRLLWSGFQLDGIGRQADQRILWADVDVPVPDGDGPHTLEVRLGSGGFPEVYWCGQTPKRWTISLEGQRQAALPEERLRSEFLGHLGLVAGPEVVANPSDPPVVAEFQDPRLSYARRYASS